MTPDAASGTRDSRYAWLLGTAGVLVVALFTLTSLRGEGSGSGGITVGGAAPPFAAPLAVLGARRSGRQRRDRGSRTGSGGRGRRSRLLRAQARCAERLRALRARAGDRRVLREPLQGVRRSSRAEHVAFY